MCVCVLSTPTHEQGAMQEAKIDWFEFRIFLLLDQIPYQG